MNAPLLVFECILALMVDQLGDRAFRRREQAHRLLMEWTVLRSNDSYAQRATVAALHRGADQTCPEASARCRKLIRALPGPDLWAVARTILPRGMAQHPWLYLGWDDAVTRAWTKYAHTLREMPYGGPANDYEDLRWACLCWVRSQLLQSRSRAEITFDLEIMAVEERCWKRDNPGR